MYTIKSLSVRLIMLFLILAFAFIATPVLADDIRNVRLVSFGNFAIDFDSQDPPNCLVDRVGLCSFNFTDDARGKPFEGIVKKEATFTLDFRQSTVNTFGFSCNPEGAINTFTGDDGSQLFIQEEGTRCTLSLDPLTLTFNNAFAITGGTGRFEGAFGGGSATGSVVGAGISAVHDGVVIIPTPNDD